MLFVILNLLLWPLLALGAISGSGGWIPSARVSLRGRQLELHPPFHNVPPAACWLPEHAAARLIDCPDAFIYVPLRDGGGLDYLHDLLEELDMIDPVVTKPRYDARGEPFHFYAPEATQPQLCEIRDGWVWLMDAERAIHKSKLTGRFVKLVEASE